MLSYKNILVGIDVDEGEGQKPFQQACALAVDNDATLYIATVLNTKGAATLERLDPKLKKTKQHAYEVLETYHQQAKKRGVSQVKVILDTGSPKTRITRHLVPQYDIDLVVVGTSTGTKMERIILGSVAEAIVRDASCDVLTVREKALDYALEESKVGGTPGYV